MPVVAHSRLTQFAVQLLSAGGADADEAAIVADSLVQVNLRGHDSHGVMRIPFLFAALAEREDRPIKRRLQDVVTGNRIVGGAGSDSFRMNGTWSIAGNILPVGFSEIETVVGISSTDSLSSGSAADAFTIGSDGVISRTMYPLTLSGFESLNGGGGTAKDTLRGTSGDDVLQLLAAGSARLNGVTVQGFESLFGGEGQDQLIGSSNAAEGMQMSGTAITVAGWTGWLMSGFETIDGGSGGSVDSLTGSAGADTFQLLESGVVLFNGVRLIGLEAINGGSGSDTVQASDELADEATVTPTGITVAGWSGLSFQGIKVLSAGNGGDVDRAIGGIGADVVSVEAAGVKLNGVSLVGISGNPGRSEMSDSSVAVFVWN